MGRKNNGTAKKLAIGGGIAAVSGFLAGILLAPKSGKQTRSDIKDAAGKGYASAEKELKKLHTDLGKAIDESKKRGGKLRGSAGKELNAVVDKAKDAKQKTSEVISALHEGDADDQDLKKAVKDAQDAISHLKVFLKKK